MSRQKQTWKVVARDESSPYPHAAIDRLSIVFILIFAVLFLGESFGVKPAIGAALMAVGAILMTIK